MTLSARTEIALASGCGGLFVAGHLVARRAPELAAVLWLSALILGAVTPVLDVWPSLRRGRISVELLMLLAAAGAAWIGDLGEGAVLMLLFSTAGVLERLTAGRTRRSLEALKSHLEDTAERLGPEGVRVVPSETLQPGDHVLIRPGARVPADGRVIDGESSVDEAALTGESLPVVKTVGDTVLSGSVNLPDGALVVEIARPAGESALAKMIRLVDEAQRNRARTQVFTDWFGERYTVLVVLAVMLSLPGFHYLAGRAWPEAFYKAMTLLVTASPCALVLATPSAILAAIACAARHGILVKGGACFEDVARAQVVVFDKTGTLTTGRPRVARVLPLNGAVPREVLRLAAAAERRSEHPLAAAVVAEAERAGVDAPPADSFRAVTGKGVVAEVEGRKVLVGNARLFADEQADFGPDCPSTECHCVDRSGCHVLRVGTPDAVGVLDITDTVRPEAREAVAALRRAGVRRVALLTGDVAGRAREVAEEAGVDEVHAELLPDEKLNRLEALRRRYGRIVMVGDGVNDAPALAAADVGVAMGGIGSDVALETADVVLTRDDLSRLPLLIQLSRRADRIVRQNLTIAIAVIAGLVSLVLATDSLRMPLAVVAHEGSTLLVILNGLRLLRSPRPA